jgi:hypothetical protein
MALPDNVEITQGTAIVFGEAGATGVTHTLGLDALGNTAARMSAYADLGADFADEYLVFFRVETGTAPTAGNTAECYLVSSHETTNFAGFASGSDGAYPPSADTAASVDQALRQLGPAVCVFVATGDATKVQRQAPAIWRPRGRYVVAVVDNNLGVAFRDETTSNADNDSRVILVPRRVRVTE